MQAFFFLFRCKKKINEKKFENIEKKKFIQSRKQSKQNKKKQNPNQS